jgi:outer membrane protein assembly factor BamB
MRNRISKLTATGFVALVFSPAATQGQDGGEVAWEVKLPGIGLAQGRSVVAAQDGGIVAAGWTASPDLTEVHAYLVKLDDHGELVWEETLGSAQDGDSDAWSVSRCADGAYIVAGSTSFFAGSKESDFYLTKRAEDGQLIWQETYGERDPDHGRAVKETSDQGFLVVGSTSFGLAVSAKVYLVKTDHEGRRMWERRYGGGVNLGAQAFVMAEVRTAATGSVGKDRTGCHLDTCSRWIRMAMYSGRMHSVNDQAG